MCEALGVQQGTKRTETPALGGLRSDVGTDSNRQVSEQSVCPMGISAGEKDNAVGVGGGVLFQTG